MSSKILYKYLYILNKQNKNSINLFLYLRLRLVNLRHKTVYLFILFHSYVFLLFGIVKIFMCHKIYEIREMYASLFIKNKVSSTE